MPYLDQYPDHWSAPGELVDGTRLRLRIVQKSDQPLLQLAVAKLSADSLRQRFLGARTSLTAAELRYFTDVDGIDHFAICAVLDDSPTVGVASARFIRMHNARDEAEIAITVIDEYQHRGLGKLLFRHLVAAAAERGIHTFHVISTMDNVAMHKIAASLTDVRSHTTEFGVTTLIASQNNRPSVRV
jgi:GNAT superfamily N-acetyltransferase